MQNVCLFLSGIFMFIPLFACSGNQNGGNVSEAAFVEVASEIYSADEIRAAIEVIIEEFDRDWEGCTLKEIYYAGDERSSQYQDWYRDLADRYPYPMDEVIVLLSSFDVDASGGDGSLNPDSTYNNWSWILVRGSGGEWQHIDHGY